MKERIPSIILIDDNLNDIYLIKREFEKNNFQADLKIFQLGLPSLEYIFDNDKNIPDALILDLNLPDINGFRLLERLRDHPKLAKTPVYIYSSTMKSEDLDKARELFAAKYIYKGNFKLDWGRITSEMKKLFEIRKYT